MSVLRGLGYFLFVLGVIVAISAGAKMPEAGRDFPETWPIFLGGACAGILGVALWRGDLARIRRVHADEAGRVGERNPVTLLQEMMEPAHRLQTDLGSLDVVELLARVEQLLEHFIQPFAESRQRVINRFGMTAGAEILVTMAYGERMLNRSWSAAADGHLAEARACVPEAVHAFDEAHAMLQQALAPENETA